MQTRRLVAAGVVVVIVIALALLVKSCDSSAATSALKNYNASVYTLIRDSVGNAQKALKDLQPGSLASVGTELATREQTARSELHKAESLQAPSQLAAAQSSLVNVMQQRLQGLELIATYAPEAADKSTSKDAVYELSRGTAQLFASDVIYKTVVTLDLAKALNSAGIPIGTGEQQINGNQVITDLGWLNQTWIGDKIGAQLSTAQANANNDQPNLIHGDQLDSTTVDGQTLTDGGSYTIPAADAQTWALGVTDGGQTNENDVGCSIKVQNQSDAGTARIPTLAANGGTGTCTVHLPSKPETGPYSVTATVDKVPGEKNLTNNSATYTINFS